jgi:hypothetical protein
MYVAPVATAAVADLKGAEGWVLRRWAGWLPRRPPKRTSPTTKPHEKPAVAGSQPMGAAGFEPATSRV